MLNERCYPQHTNAASSLPLCCDKKLTAKKGKFAIISYLAIINYLQYPINESQNLQRKADGRGQKAEGKKY
ncbi:hypothetical protein NIES4075_61870 [Tolypothrix sp. NIES-4075]|nr:hypothetical protein NIES4075_61870 [Tolypothrix sp. NIES-4075]